MSRWLTQNFIKCGHCLSTQRYVSGYKDIPNPILYSPEEHTRHWHTHQRISVHHIGLDIYNKCNNNNCGLYHGKWTVLSHNAYLAEREECSKRRRIEEKVREMTGKNNNNNNSSNNNRESSSSSEGKLEAK
eukprot:Tbor_TRINITY_DN5213_c4_g1::TRINITY_DN5213_c4_g1_i1::g.16223::m.16223